MAESAVSSWYVYMLECADGSLYIGVATDVERRLRQHNGELVGGARYTSGRRPVQLVWSEGSVDRASAQAREAQIKSWQRGDKLKLLTDS